MSRPAPQHLRVFLGSPGDVLEERREALRILGALPGKPLLKGAVTIEIDAWSPERTPMEANADGQESVVKYVGRPSECDLTIIVLWSRLGTPLPAEKAKADGSRYRSGTEWELEDALGAGRPVFLYVRTEPPPPPANDEEREQRERLQKFLAGLNAPDGSIRAARNDYDSPATFARLLEAHLEAFVAKRIGRRRFIVGAPALAAAAVAGLGLGGGWWYLSRPRVALDPVPAGLLNSEDRQVTLWIGYQARNLRPEDRVQAQVTATDDPGFSRRPFHEDDVERESQRRYPLVVPLVGPRPVEARWEGWLRLAVIREGEVVATSRSRSLEATPR